MRILIVGMLGLLLGCAETHTEPKCRRTMETWVLVTDFDLPVLESEVKNTIRIEDGLTPEGKYCRIATGYGAKQVSTHEHCDAKMLNRN